MDRQSVRKTGLTQTFRNDALGRRVASVASRTGASVTHYNARSQVDWVSDPASNRTHFVYDLASGRRVAVSNAVGGVIQTAYDLRGQVLATWGATYPVAYEYDAFGRMTAMYTTRSNALSLASFADFCSNLSAFDKTAWQYDLASGLLTNKVYADGNGTAYTYTPLGQLASRRWARGITTTYAYEPRTGVMTNIAYSDGTPGVSFAYDRFGRQTSITDAQGLHGFAYDPASLVLTQELTQVSASLPQPSTNLLART